MHGGFRYRGGGTCNEMQYLIASSRSMPVRIMESKGHNF